MKFPLSFVSVFFALMSFTTHAATDVTRGQIDSQGGLSATMTINVGGVHQLSGNYSGEIVINASNVTFDLRGFTVNGATRGIRVVGSNVTVQNGIVRGAGIGVRLEGSNNFLIGLDVVSNGTGVEIISNGNMIENCNAYSNISAGFSLEGASRNYLYNCMALDNGSAGNAYGFISQDGSANTFEECIAERTQTDGGASVIAAGFVFVGTEQESQIVQCEAHNATGLINYGVLMQNINCMITPTLTFLPSATVNLGATLVSAVDWQQIGNSYYVATGGLIPSVNVFRFNSDAATFSVLPSGTYGAFDAINTLAWQQIGSSYYLAFGNFSGLIQILQFNSSIGLLSALESGTFYTGGVISSVAWQQIGDSYYLALADEGMGRLMVLQFNPATGLLTELPLASVSRTAARSVAWQQVGSSYYLALVFDGNPYVDILQFNPVSATLNPLSTGVLPYASANRVAWQKIGYSYYLAVGMLSSNPTVRILEFNSTTGSLSQLPSASVNLGSTNVNALAWQQVGNSYYLAVGTNTILVPDLRVLNFNPLTRVLSASDSLSYDVGTEVLGLAWQQIGNSYYLAQVGSPSPVVSILRTFNVAGCPGFPQSNLLMYNKATGNGVGFQDDQLVYSTNQWVANFGANNTTNFNIGSQFPISSAKGTGVGTAENIDASLTIGGPAEQIMATIVDQAAPTIAEVDTFVQCQPNYITGATTLSSGSYYALGRAVNGQITLNGVSDVSLNLMGRRVRNILVQNCSRITILNGYISGAGVTNALDINGSTNVSLEDLFVTGAIYGLRGQNQAGNITANNCFFNSNTSAGVQIDSGRGNSFTFCMANKNGTDGFVLTGTGHTATYCMANRNAAGAGFKLAANSITNEIRSCSACANTTGYDFAITTSNIAINNFASGNTSANYVTNIRWGVTTATPLGNVNYTANIQI